METVQFNNLLEQQESTILAAQNQEQQQKPQKSINSPLMEQEQLQITALSEMKHGRTTENQQKENEFIEQGNRIEEEKKEEEDHLQQFQQQQFKDAQSMEEQLGADKLRQQQDGDEVDDREEQQKEIQNNLVQFQDVPEVQQQPQVLGEKKEAPNQESSYDEELERLTPIKFQNKRIKKSFQKHVKKIRGNPSSNEDKNKQNKSTAKNKKTARVNQFEQTQARLLKDIANRNARQQK